MSHGRTPLGIGSVVVLAGAACRAPQPPVPQAVAMASAVALSGPLAVAPTPSPRMLQLVPMTTSGASGPSGPSAPDKRPVYFVGVDITKLRTATKARSLAGVEALLRDGYGANVLRSSTDGFVGVVARMDDADAARLRKDGPAYVRYVFRDTVAHADSCDLPPDGTSAVGQGWWGVARIRHRGWPIPACRPACPSCRRAGRGVRVVLIDSGVQKTHVQFARTRFGRGRSLTGGQPLRDELGHGTQVAAIVLAKDFGLAPSAILHSYQALTLLEDGRVGSDGNTLEAALRQVREDQRDVKRLIVLACWNFEEPHPAVEEQVSALIASGAAVVVSAGNQRPDGAPMSPSPAGVAGCIGVGALDASDTPWSRTLRGPHVKVWAPGAQIETATIGPGDDLYASVSGTSIAAPHVAGVLAQYMGKGMGMSAQEAINQLLRDSESGCLDGTLLGESANVRLVDVPCPF